MTSSSRTRSAAKTASTNGAVSTLTDEDLSSNAQRERRKRILDATLAIASKGGYEAVQMRAVAERADVAVGTLYRYFPSKVHLLVSALGREFETIDAKTDPARRHARSAAAPDGRQAQPGDAAQSAAHRGHDPRLRVRRRLRGRRGRSRRQADRLAVRARDERRRTDRGPVRIARVISDVWLSNLLAWLTRRASATDVGKRLELAVELLLGDGTPGSGHAA